MTRFGMLFFALAACTSSEQDTTTFHGTVGQAVTHVMAVSPVAGDLQRTVAPIEGGTFSIDVEPGRPWALVFVNANHTGADMVTGVLRSDTLDTFLPQTAGNIDLGHVTIDNRDATMAGSSDDLDTALGLSRRTLTTLGGLDDIALRYANPDVDGDGILDVEQDHTALLELHLDYALTAAGRAATADDFVARASHISYEHVGTGIAGRFSGSIDPATAHVAFEQPYWGYGAGPFTPPVAAGQPVTDVVFGADHHTFGVFARPDHPIPSGNYRFVSGAHSMTFTMVRPPTEMLMHQVMPRIHFVPIDPNCTASCTLSAIEYSWQRNTEFGWVTLTAEEAHVLQPTASIDILTVNGHRRYDLPVGEPTGTMNWEQALYRQEPMTTGDITYLNIGFQLRPGIKMYASLGEGGGVGVDSIDLEPTR